MASIGSMRTPATSPSNSAVSSTTASPCSSRSVAGRQPAGLAHDRRPGLVADQWHPSCRAAPCAPCRAAPRRQTINPGCGGAPGRHVGHFDVEPVGAQQPGQHHRQGGVAADHDQPSVWAQRGVDRGRIRDFPIQPVRGQAVQRTRCRLLAEHQHRHAWGVLGRVHADIRLFIEVRRNLLGRVCHRLDNNTQGACHAGSRPHRRPVGRRGQR